MKKNPAVLGFVISLFAVIVAFGIYFLFLAKTNEYLVDNPTPNTYYFKINKGAEKVITAGQFVKVELAVGKNSISVFDDKKNLMFDSAFAVNKVRGLINITHSDYYINKQYYGYNINKDSLITHLGKTEIDGKLYLGDPKKFNKLYTDDFYYNVNEEYDKVIKNIDKIESRTKIFRKQDFLNYYKEYYKF